jgi:hypothetical protein
VTLDHAHADKAWAAHAIRRVVRILFHVAEDHFALPGVLIEGDGHLITSHIVASSRAWLM